MEEQEDRAQLREEQERLALRDGLERGPAHESQVPEQDPRAELAQHGGLAEALEDLARELGADQDQRKREQSRRGRRRHGGRWSQRQPEAGTRRLSIARGEWRGLAAFSRGAGDQRWTRNGGSFCELGVASGGQGKSWGAS